MRGAWEEMEEGSDGDRWVGWVEGKGEPRDCGGMCWLCMAVLGRKGKGAGGGWRQRGGVGVGEEEMRGEGALRSAGREEGRGMCFRALRGRLASSAINNKNNCIKTVFIWKRHGPRARESRRRLVQAPRSKRQQTACGSHVPETLYKNNKHMAPTLRIDRGLKGTRIGTSDQERNQFAASGLTLPKGHALQDGCNALTKGTVLEATGPLRQCPRAKKATNGGNGILPLRGNQWP